MVISNFLVIDQNIGKYGWSMVEMWVEYGWNDQNMRILIKYGWSMGEIWKEYGWDMVGIWIEYGWKQDEI